MADPVPAPAAPVTSARPFVHLHCHTHYSLLDGVNRIPDLVSHVKSHGMNAVAITDHGNLYGAIEFYNACKAGGIKPIVGCEVYVAPGSRLDKKPGAGMRDVYHHLVLLAKDTAGYHNLVRLVTAANLDGFYYKPRIDKDLLAKHSKGLIALSACLRGDINETLMADKYEDARKIAYDYQDMFGKNNFFLELQDHGLDEDRIAMPAVHRLAADTGMPLVVTNDSHYLEHGDAQPPDDEAGHQLAPRGAKASRSASPPPPAATPPWCWWTSPRTCSRATPTTRR